MKKWNDTDQHQLCHEALQWLGFKGDESDGICFKKEQHIFQKVFKKFDEKRMASAMKEIRNLAVKNDYFVEVDYDKLSQEMKDKALPLLILIVMKLKGEIKFRGCANGSYHIVHIDKYEFTSPTPDFYSVKCVCRVSDKERRDVATINLTGFFL